MLEDLMRSKKVRAHLASLGLQVHEARAVFRLLDIEKSSRVKIDNFVMACMRLKGNAKSVDLATLLREHKRLYSRLSGLIRVVQWEFKQLRGMVTDVRMSVTSTSIV